MVLPQKNKRYYIFYPPTVYLSVLTNNYFVKKQN